MFRILRKRRLAEGTHDFWVEAPEVAQHARPGQFLVVRIHEQGERIPLTIADAQDGKVRIVVKAVGKTTYELCSLKEGDELADVVGPLGHPSEIDRFGHVLLVGGGVGIAAIYPIARELKRAGNRVTVILGGRTADQVIMRDEFDFADRVLITTDDGSLGMKGVVTDAMKVVLDSDEVDIAWAIGPTIMMKFCALLARERDLKIWTSLNPIMVDGTGMCGACRVSVNGKIRFACVDGPEFDGRFVDWDELLKRLTIYREEEKKALERYLEKVGEPTWL
ncbi:MAG: ferredoxin/flavodoxin---NADP+ reductase [Thermotogota bacterium]|nr:ferredoxin/flavodoxin---NADP+ reductase [Thermotogota bacterium]MDK2864325.1 ferredoxin/flavodoxin---NADP+ reductase [Thermotogota bacterium]HCZ06341.1 dihydroorotate dehydrogenase [Thermotogota bacterium]